MTCLYVNWIYLCSSLQINSSWYKKLPVCCLFMRSFVSWKLLMSKKKNKKPFLQLHFYHQRQWEWRIIVYLPPHTEENFMSFLHLDWLKIPRDRYIFFLLFCFLFFLGKLNTLFPLFSHMSLQNLKWDFTKGAWKHSQTMEIILFVLFLLPRFF